MNKKMFVFEVSGKSPSAEVPDSITLPANDVAKLLTSLRVNISSHERSLKRASRKSTVNGLRASLSDLRDLYARVRKMSNEQSLAG